MIVHEAKPGDTYPMLFRRQHEKCKEDNTVLNIVEDYIALVTPMIDMAERTWPISILFLVCHNSSHQVYLQIYIIIDDHCSPSLAAGDDL